MVSSTSCKIDNSVLHLLLLLGGLLLWMCRYCECFASGTYCEGCNCVNCCNNVENESVRQEAVEATLERNPNAFRPKIFSSPSLRDLRVCPLNHTGMFI